MPIISSHQPPTKFVHILQLTTSNKEEVFPINAFTAKINSSYYVTKANLAHFPFFNKIVISCISYEYTHTLLDRLLDHLRTTSCLVFSFIFVVSLSLYLCPTSV
jgi:hypothetical protein